MTADKEVARHVAEEHIGAVEGDRPNDAPQHGNPNATPGGLDESGVPSDRVKVCEDVLGANQDKTTG